MKIKLSDYELGWLVGILEGEGHFDYNGCSQKVQIRMIDFDTMRAAGLLFGKILGSSLTIKSHMPGGNRQEIFSITLCGENARTIMKVVASYMYSRRRAKIWQSLNKYREPKKFGLDELEEAIDKLRWSKLNARDTAGQRSSEPDPGGDTFGSESDATLDSWDRI